FREGLNQKNLRSIFADHKVDVIVDEMDDLRMKILLREQAKRLALPVVMAADDGDNSLLDIERYDLQPDMPLFSGLVPDEIVNHIKNDDIPRRELGMLIGKYFVGVENTPLRMFQSLMEVGKSLPSWPQLGGAAALSGLVIAYAIRCILLKQDVRQGRTLVTIDSELNQEQYSEAHKKELEKILKIMQGS
ncbi:MAG: hypothetical protein AAB649_02685, partial [Patescibacteria group bacterium]